MYFALVNGQRTAPQKGLIGKCPVCDQEVRSRVGQIRTPHWFHLSLDGCDYDREPETEWHRSWKAHFPVDWHEYLHKAPDGEKFIADVRTDKGWVIEFQHSPIAPEERQSRDDFYKPMVWVVNGTRRGNDASKFYRVVSGAEQVSPQVIKTYTKDSALLRDWEGSKWPIFFDFGDKDDLWCLLKGSPDSPSYFARLSHSEFVTLLKDSPEGQDSFGLWLAVIRYQVTKHEAPPVPPKVQSPQPAQARMPNPLAPPIRRSRRL